MTRTRALGLGLGALLVLALAYAVRTKRTESGVHGADVPASIPASGAAGPLLRIPRAQGDVKIDGHLDDGAWVQRSARTGVFFGADGSPGRPHAEARMIWNDEYLYLALYAADRDIRASAAAPDAPLWTDGDTFQLVFFTPDGERRIELSPEGKVTDARQGADGRLNYAWQSGVKVEHDVDGTINDPSDEDEEWVLELAIPLTSLALEGKKGAHAGLHIRRCDSNVPRVCTAWGPPEGGASLVFDD